MYDTINLMQAMETISTSKITEFYTDALKRQDPIWAVTAQETLAKRNNYEAIVKSLLEKSTLEANSALTEAIIGSCSRMRSKSPALYYFSKKASERIKSGLKTIDTAEVFGDVIDESTNYNNPSKIISQLKHKKYL